MRYVLRKPQGYVIVAFRIKVHPGYDEVCAVDKVLDIYVVSAGASQRRVCVIGNLYKTVETPDSITVKPVC